MVVEKQQLNDKIVVIIFALMPIPILSNALLILSKEIVIQKLNITTEEYISNLGFTDVSKHVFQDDYLIAVRAMNPDELYADRFIKGLHLDEDSMTSKDFTIATCLKKEIVLWEVNWLILDGQFVVHRDHHSEVKDRLEEVKKIPFTQFIHYWKENSF